MSDEEMASNALPGPMEPVASTSTSTDTSVPAAPVADGEAPLSKKAQKRAAKRAKFESLKLEKRAAERVRRRERAHNLAAGYAAGTLSAEDTALFEKQRELKRQRKASSRGIDSGVVHPAAVVVDLGFDNLMTDQEITSMHSQLGFVYSINRTAKRPFSAVVHTGFSPETAPRLWTKMGKAQWQRWQRMWFMRGDVGDLAKELGKSSEEEEAVKSEATEEKPASSTAGPSEPALTAATTYPELVRHLTPGLPSTIPATHKLVYLSADADEELTDLSEDEVYVIGGIVDRNRHKMLCQNKADGLGIRTARLPIGTYLADLPTRKVLTVNQVFDILSQYLALNDWKAAFEAVIPSRKYYTSKDEKTKANKARADSDDEDDEDEVEGAVTGEANEDDEHPEAEPEAGDVSMGDEEEAMNA